MAKDHKPKPVDPSNKTGTGKQMDDNVDDLGRRPDGTRLDQPGATKPSKQDDAKVRRGE